MNKTSNHLDYLEQLIEMIKLDLMVKIDYPVHRQLSYIFVFSHHHLDSSSATTIKKYNILYPSI